MQSPDEIFRGIKHKPSDPDLWIQLYDLLEPRLNRFCFFLAHQFGSEEDPGDIVHDVLLKLVQDFRKITAHLNSFSHLQSYLYQACRNRLIDHYRHRRTVTTAEEVLRLRFDQVVSESFRKELEKTENRQFLEDILNGIGPSCRDLIRTYLLSEQSLADYAESRGIKLGTIYKQWSRCIQEIREKIGPSVRNFRSQP